MVNSTVVLSVYRFHVNIFAKPPSTSFAITWEDAATMLERLPRMIFEPDGSFVVSGTIEQAGPRAPSRSDGRAPISNERWQVDGHLFDFNGQLHRLELHGECPPAAFDELLRCVGWPGQPAVFEMVREGVKLDEPAVRVAMSDKETLH